MLLPAVYPSTLIFLVHVESRFSFSRPRRKSFPAFSVSVTCQISWFSCPKKGSKLVSWPKPVRLHERTCQEMHQKASGGNYVAYVGSNRYRF